MEKEIIAELCNIADNLDEIGMAQEASEVDILMEKYAADYGELLRVIPNLLRIFNRVLAINSKAASLRLITPAKVSTMPQEELVVVRSKCISIIKSYAQIIEEVYKISKEVPPSAVTSIAAGRISTRDINSLAVIFQKMPVLKAGRLRRFLNHIPQTRALLQTYDLLRYLSSLLSAIEKRKNELELQQPAEISEDEQPEKQGDIIDLKPSEYSVKQPAGKAASTH